MFINFSNHSSNQWSADQIAESLTYGEILDIPFPLVSPHADEEEVLQLAQDCVREICEKKPSAVMCQGEFTLSYQVISLLKERGITVLAACSNRNVTEDNGVKHVIFEFCRYRKY